MLEMNERGRIGVALLALMASAACGGGDSAATGGATTSSAAIENPVDAATAGSLSGRVSFVGTPPAPQPIDMREEPVCADKHSTPPVREVVVVDGNGGLANVFVYVKSGPVTGMRFPVPTNSPMLDQDGCVYLPHVIGVQVGQPLTVRNSDAVLHNVAASPRENRPFNRTQPQANMEFQHPFTAAEVMIPIRCDVHGWMESFVGVTSHPYHAVTSGAGSFSMANLPPGEYELEAWHERFGTLTQTVTIPASGAAEVTFEFNDQMVGRHVPMGAPMVIDYETGTLRPADGVAEHAHPGN